MRLRAALDGATQSLVDVEGQMRQVGPRIEQAIGEGGDVAEKALDEETSRMTAYLQGVAADLASVGRQLDEVRGRDRGKGPVAEQRSN
jgi:hypothetical protein